MDINNHNYEEFAIDYLEGNLSAEMGEAMQLFLMQNPEIEAELMGLEEVVLQPDMEVVFSDKASLLQLEESRKIVPLYLQWKRYVLPIAAALCLFFVWQVVLQSPVDVGKDDELAVVEGDEKKKKEAVIEGGSHLALEETKKGKGEKERLNIDSVMEITLKPKVKGIESAAITNTAMPKLNMVKETQKIPSKNELVVVEFAENKEPANAHLGERNGGEAGALTGGIDHAVKVGFEGNEERTMFIDAKGIERGKAMTAKKDSFKDKIKTLKREPITLVILPQKSNEMIEDIVALVEEDFRDLPEMSAEPVERKKQKSTFLNNLKRAITPEIFANDELYEPNNGSEVLVSISVKPEQHNLIKKIFKNNR